MTAITLAAEFANLSLDVDASDAPGRDDSVRTLRDLELTLVGGGENIPAWGTTP